jgi:NAD(P) transhydrogenase subunit alpha
MNVGAARESCPGERRVALTPTAVAKLVNAGLGVFVEADAGADAGFLDGSYLDAGAHVVATRTELFERADVVPAVRLLGANPEAGRSDLHLLRSEHTLVGMADPLGAPQAVGELAERGVTAFSMELMPRITRAQSMDALSSQATVAGYKAVLIAAERHPRMFPMLMTAAGTILPARVFVVGCGVAGLQAIATARRLGAKVQAYDVRPTVKEQVESLGATFVEFDLETGDAEDAGGYAKAQDGTFYRRQREEMAKVVAASDVVITTAAIPGRQAPVLVTTDMVAAMPSGSVIVDLAAERGGNVEPSRPDEWVVIDGVAVCGPTNLPSNAPYHASQMYANNITSFLLHVAQEGELDLDTDDEIIGDTLLTRQGNVVNDRVRELLGLDPQD